MHIKQFRAHEVRVPDPLRPGKRAFETRLLPTGGTSLSHGGKTYEADPSGWFDVPPEVGTALLRFRAPNGERFYTPPDVDEQVRLGAMTDELPEPAPVPRVRRAAAAV